jgi:hypothetical protein
MSPLSVGGYPRSGASNDRGVARNASSRPRRQDYRPVPVITVSILPPGKSVVWIQGTGWSGHLSGRSAAEITFTDRAGVHWVRRGGGQLIELSENPYKYFGRHGLTAPYELQLLSRDS